MFFCVEAVIADLTFAITHRILHINPLYRWVHKIHHEYQSPAAFGAVYCHWFEHIFGNLFSVIPCNF